MTPASLFEIVSALRNRTDPRTGQHYSSDTTCLTQPAVRRALNQLARSLVIAQGPEVAAREINIPAAEVESACAALRELGYQPVAGQLARVFTGSRSIADARLRGLAAFGRYQGVYSRRLVTEYLQAFARHRPEVLDLEPRERPERPKTPYESVDFFRTAPFNHLTPEQEADFRRGVAELGMKKTSEFLPDYMARVRADYPRAYEPWTDAERALLVEAMCYTNELGRLATLFDRTTRSLELAGQKLIYDSQEKRRA